jgi:hypothetical protein
MTNAEDWPEERDGTDERKTQGPSKKQPDSKHNDRLIERGQK